MQIAIHLYSAGRLDCLLLRGRRRRSNDGCASAGEKRLAVEGRGDEAADGGASHGPKLPAATAPGPCFLDDAEASAALARSRGGARSRGRRRSRPLSAEPAAGGARARAGVVAGDARLGAGRARPRRPKICVVSVEDAYLRFRSGGRQNRFADWVFCWTVYLAIQTTV